MTSKYSIASTVPALCRGEHDLLDHWINAPLRSALLFCLPAITLGCGVYGFSMGLWQGAHMASFVGLKLPLVIFATLLLNGMINGMLAMVLGSGIGLRQSIQFLLAGFTLMSIILASLSPITLMMALHAPDPVDPGADQWHRFTLLSHTFLIAYAGITSHHSLLGHVRRHAHSRAHGTRTFYAWLAGNLFVGAQVSWIMRPFFGSPGLEVQLLRDDPFNGSFYETVLNALLHII